MNLDHNKLIDNSNDCFMRDVIKEFLMSGEFNIVLIASGYWDLPGMNLIKNELKEFLNRENTCLKLLIGEDPRVRAYQQIKPGVKDPKFPEDYIKQDIHSIKENLIDEFQDVINILYEYCNEEPENSKFEIRVYRNKENAKTQFLHSKCYIFEGQDRAAGIIGSSNFTAKGLEDNAELNYLERQPMLVSGTGETATGNYKTHHTWFYEKWEKSEFWNKTFLTEVLKTSPIWKKFANKKLATLTAPYEIYIRYLQHFFDDAINLKRIKSLIEFLPDEVQKLDYQFSAVNQAYSIMKMHGGFFLADVVGLGKTITAVLLIKLFLEDYSDIRNKKVLIVTPPAIKSNWDETINLFDSNEDQGLKKRIDFITTGKVVDIDNTVFENFTSPALDDNVDELKALKENLSYGLIIIDESHNFRNSESKMYKALNDLIGEINPQPYIGLLSATPQNNSPEDLKNQIFLFQRTPQSTTLSGIPNDKLNSYFAEKKTEFDKLRKQKNNQKELVKLSEDIRDKVLKQLVVRRTRTDLKKWYADDVKNLNFPKIRGPILIKYSMSDTLSVLFAETMNIIARYDNGIEDFSFSDESLNFYRYRALEYLKKGRYKEVYGENRNVKDVSLRLAKIMQVQLVKRLESSFSAFKKSLQNLKKYTYNMIQMLENDIVFICPDIDINDEFKKAMNFNDACLNIKKKIKSKSENNKLFSTNDFEPVYLENLKKDFEILDQLCTKWANVTYDPKLEAFKRAITSCSENDSDTCINLFDPKKNNPHKYDKQKLVIFTESVDTALALTDTIDNLNLTNSLKRKVLTITAENREKDKEKIKENFDANSKIQKDDYDILITTDVLAEGVNLHRSNTILNYDVPWNATRLMQRIGRVNRIGSEESNVYVYNFMPTNQSDELINLVSIAHSKLQAFHTMFGEDSRIFTEDEEVFSFGTAPSEKDLNVFFDGEESVQEKYISELRNLKKINPKEYERIASLKLPLISFGKKEPTKFLSFIKTQNTAGEVFFVENNKPLKISPNDVMEKLKSIEEYNAQPLDLDLVEKIKELTRKAYKHDKQAMVTKKELTKKQNEAIELCVEIFNINNISKESEDLLKHYRDEIKSGDSSKADKIIKLYNAIQQDKNKLFEDDIDALIKSNLVMEKDSKPSNKIGNEEFFFVVGF